MTALVLDGRSLAARVAEGLAGRVTRMVESGHPRPRLAVVQFRSGGPEAAYGTNLARAATEIGVMASLVELPMDIAFEALAGRIAGLNRDESLAGTVISHPVPRHLDRDRVIDLLDPARDVDGAHPMNAGRIALGGSGYVPGAALAVMAMLDGNGVSVAGRRVVVVGRSALLGRPVASLLVQADATVTVCHRGTPDLASETRRAEILVVAAGSPGLIGRDMVAPDAVVVDAGYNVVDGSVVGDVDYAAVREVAGAITPVPGGVGRVTTMMVLEQTVRAAETAAGARAARDGTSRARGEAVR